MTNVENMTTEELRERAPLIQQMRADIEAISKLDVFPEEHDMRAVAAYRGDLEAIAEIDVPDEDDVKDVAQRRRHEQSAAPSRMIPWFGRTRRRVYRNEHYRRFPWRVFNA
jgi:hypothetical protein